MHWFILPVLALIIGLVVIVLHWRSKQPRYAGGYLSFAKDKDRSKHVADLFALRDRDRALLMELEPDRLVDMLVSPQARSDIVYALETQGERAVPALTKALSDPRFRVPYSPQQRSAMDMILNGATPLESILRCLRRYSHPQLLCLLLPLCSDNNKQIRQEAGGIVASIGTDECIASITELLADHDEYLRDDVLAGIVRATERDVSPHFRHAVYNAVLSVLRMPDVVSGTNPATCLIALDRSRALQDLLTPAVFSPSNSVLQNTIKSLSQAKVSIPESLLLPVLAAAELEPDEHPNDRLISEVLKNLALQESPESTTVIARNRKSPSKNVREAALEAQCILSGLAAPWDAAFARVKDRKVEEAEPPVQHVLLCRFLIDQVDNGGISQFFVNGYGRRWRQTLTALQTIKATDTHSILEEAVAKFGPDGPDLNRYDQAVAEMHEKDDKVWADLDTRFFEDRDTREVLLLEYMIQNATLFKPTK